MELRTLFKNTTRLIGNINNRNSPINFITQQQQPMRKLSSLGRIVDTKLPNFWHFRTVRTGLVASHQFALQSLGTCRSPSVSAVRLGARFCVVKRENRLSRAIFNAARRTCILSTPSLENNQIPNVSNEDMAKNQLAPTILLNNGCLMPVLGLGTYESKNNEGEMAVKHAIDVGYRHIDTAYFYQNETEIGRAIRAKISEGVVERKDLFIVTKLWNIHHDPEHVERACRKQLELFGLDYIDLYLMHMPVGYKYVDEETLLPMNKEGVLQLSDIDYFDTYKAMEKLVKLGLVRSIGVSNFNSEQLKRVLDHCEIKPVTNQVECSPALNQKKLTAFCKEHGITVTAYSPLGRPKPDKKTPSFIYSEKTKAIAEKYNKTSAQIVLRYLVDIGNIPIPKSVNPKRIEENFNIFDFKLTPEEIEIMDGFNTGERIVPFNLIKGQNHKYWPFATEF